VSVRRRGSNVIRLERELDVLRETIAQTEAERDKQIELAEQAASERRDAAHDRAAFGEAARRAGEHRLERDRLGFVLERHASDRARLERELGHARYEDGYAAVESALSRRQTASTAVAKQLAATIDTLPALEAARDEVDAALVRARELCPDDIDFELPQNADEAELPDGVNRLVEFVQAGARRPIAETSAALERIRREAESATATVGKQAAREAIVNGDFERLGRISPEQRRAAVAAAEDLARWTPSNDRAAEIAQRRLNRVRELAAEAAQVEAAA
jgi:hypothetical protein